MQKSLWDCIKNSFDVGVASSMARTMTSGHMVYAGFGLNCDQLLKYNYFKCGKVSGLEFSMELTVGRKSTMDKMVVVHAEKHTEAEMSKVWADGTGLAKVHCTRKFDEVSAENSKHWGKIWDTFDISIEGDPCNQQGIRYCIFQMHQTYHGGNPGLNIGAKGLTGEAYGGQAFWDTETYCLPFYLFNNPKAARNLLEFRYNTLSKAMERARDLDCEGACYPIATLDGTESCTLWQHASLQFQPSTAVAYGIWHYVKITGDNDFLYEKGIEMLVQICRFLATRGQWAQEPENLDFMA